MSLIHRAGSPGCPKKSLSKGGLFLDGGEGGIDSNSLGAAFTPSGQYRKRYRLNRSLGRALSNPEFSSILLFIHPKKSLPKGGLFLDGGEGGIRTLDTLPYTHFPGVRLRPLGHFSEAAENTTDTRTAPKRRALKCRTNPQT